MRATWPVLRRVAGGVRGGVSLGAAGRAGDGRLRDAGAGHVGQQQRVGGLSDRNAGDRRGGGADPGADDDRGEPGDAAHRPYHRRDSGGAGRVARGGAGGDREDADPQPAAHRHRRGNRGGGIGNQPALCGGAAGGAGRDGGGAAGALRGGRRLAQLGEGGGAPGEVARIVAGKPRGIRWRWAALMLMPGLDPCYSRAGSCLRQHR